MTSAPSIGNYLVVQKEPSELEYANALADQLPQLITCGSRWFAYKGGCFRETTRDIFRPAAQAILPPEARTARREKVLLEHLEGRNQVALQELRGALAFDDDPETILINTELGIVRLTAQTLDLLPASPEWKFTKSIGVAFDPKADCPLFKRILEQCLPEFEDRELFQLCTGNFLLPDSRYEIALDCFGEAGRGKSTVADPIANALGDELVTRLSISQICDPKSYSLPKLQFAAVNLGTELESLAVEESGNFKTIVSGEPVEARPIYGAPFTMRTSCKLWFLSNGLPRFKNGTEAELRRMRFIRFDYKPDQIDVTLKTRLSHERAGVFNFMLEGLQKLLTLRTMPYGGPQSREVHERFKTSNDPLGAFLRERCHIDKEGRTRKSALHEAFVEFCDNKNLPQDLGNTFFKRLYDRFPEVKATRAQDDIGRVQMLTGIRLKQSV